MSLAKIAVAGIFLCLTSFAGSAPLNSWQTSQENSGNTSQKPGDNQQPTTSPTTPCPTSQNGTASSDCKAASSKPKIRKKNHKQTRNANGGPSKTVVRDGGTGEPAVAISPGEQQRQTARKQETDRLLASADLNLKDVAVRGLKPSQRETIKQIRTYMEQAKAAANSGDVDRAYNLANKANMLAADLNAH